LSLFETELAALLMGRMKRLLSAAATLNQTPLDWDGNRDNILGAIADARAQGATLLCTPELGITGYGAEDAFLWPATCRLALEVLGELLPHTRGMIVAVGLPVEVDGAIYNGAALLVDGDLIGVALKRHLAGTGVHYEPRWFKGWPAGTSAAVEIFKERIPVGDLLFEVGGLRLGFEICEDAWIEPRPARGFCQQGAEVILSPSASHFSFRKFSQRRALVGDLVSECGPNYIYCNLLGNEAGRAIYDGDAFIACRGPQGAEVLASTSRFSFASRQLAFAQIAWSGRPLTEAVRDVPIVRTPFEYPELKGTLLGQNAGINDGELSREVALGRVLSLGLFDYLRKSHSRGFVVSLSGGADSGATAILVWLMLILSENELGRRGALERLLQAVPEGLLGEEVEIRSICRYFLLTIYQGTKNSSEVTRTAARELAHQLGAEHHEVDIEAITESYRSLTEETIGRELSWARDDIALQNIQARVRAPGVWMLANLRGALLLSTSNRSEAAVGYATMDGDTAGGLCPLGGVGKAYLRKWLIFMEKEGFTESGPLSVLRLINDQQPTAELRPPERAQTDEGDLMPYELLDAIERLSIVSRKSPREVYFQLGLLFPGYSAEELLVWLRRFYRLFPQNQWKRERLAPSFHVDDASLDPKTWCRFPILSGGFQRELDELERELAQG
jgi:NAD+ synthase (glutamine-hydrolysing)